MPGRRRTEITMRMRMLAAAGVLVSGAVHFKLYFDWAHENDKVGPAFLLNAGAGVVIAVLLISWRHWIPPLLAVGFGGVDRMGSLDGGGVGARRHCRGRDGVVA